jgi:hypothetical protein
MENFKPAHTYLYPAIYLIFILLSKRRGIHRFDFSNQQLTLPAKKCQFLGLFAYDISCRSHFASEEASKPSLFETAQTLIALRYRSVSPDLYSGFGRQ